MSGPKRASGLRIGDGVLDAIDSAVADWTVSTDAMRVPSADIGDDLPVCQPPLCWLPAGHDGAHFGGDRPGALWWHLYAAAVPGGRVTILLGGASQGPDDLTLDTQQRVRDVPMRYADTALPWLACWPYEPLEDEVEQALPPHLRDEGGDSVAEHVGVCRTCGCTDDEACEGGCSWTSTPHLCSRCA